MTTQMQAAFDNAFAKQVLGKGAGVEVPITIAHVQSGWTRKTKPELRRNRLMFIVTYEAQQALGWPNHRFMYSVEGSARKGLEIIPDSAGLLSMYKYNNSSSLTGSINSKDVGTWALYKHGRETITAIAEDGVLKIPALPKRYWDSWSGKRDMKANGISYAEDSPEPRSYTRNRSAGKMKARVKDQVPVTTPTPRAVAVRSDTVDDLRVAVNRLNESISKVSEATLRVEDNRAVVEVKVIETFR